MLRGVTVLLLAALVLAGAAFATASTRAVRVHAELRAVAGGRGHGSFSGTVSGPGTRPRFLWTILFFDLGGPAVEADLRLGPSGGVLFPLCRPCRAGRSGSTILTARGVRAIESGRTYVVVRTAKHPDGELRGRLVVTR